MRENPYDPETMVVRDIEDVTEELTKLMISKLPGNQMVKAAWGSLCEARRIYEFAKGVLDEDDMEIYRRFQYHGEAYAASQIIRQIADGLGVSNFKKRGE